jgi:hypothetical protein
VFFWREFLSHLHWVAIVLFAVALLAVGISVLWFRRARLDRYYVMREMARRRGVLWLLVTLVSFLVSVVLLCVRSCSPHIPATPSPQPTTATVPAATLTSATDVPSFTPLPSPTPTRRPTATPPASPTPTPGYPLPETALSPLPGAVAAGPDAEITFRAFALDVENGRPVDPGSLFPSGDYRLYFFFEYQGMATGVTWTYGWYREGEYIEGNTCLWGVDMETEVGPCPRIGGSAGSNYLYFRMPGGYEPGTYEVHVWIEERFQIVAQFTITAP